MPSAFLLFIGDNGIGMKSLINTYRAGVFPIDYIPFVFEGFVPTVNIGDEIYTLSVLELNDIFSNRDQFLTLANVIIICFSLNDKRSLMNVKKKWITLIKKKCPDTPFIIAGLKSDLRDENENNLFISTQEIEEFMLDINECDYIECSSFKGVNVNEVIEIALMKAIHHMETDNYNTNKDSKSVKSPKSKCNLV